MKRTETFHILQEEPLEQKQAYWNGCSFCNDGCNMLQILEVKCRIEGLELKFLLSVALNDCWALIYSTQWLPYTPV